MLKVFEELKGALSLPLVDINDKNIRYDNVILFELDEIVKKSTLTTKRNEYSQLINLYYITKEEDLTHYENSINIISQLELHNARAIQNIIFSKLLIVNATKYIVTQYALQIETIKFCN